jgi:hypothetical protein
LVFLDPELGAMDPSDKTPISNPIFGLLKTKFGCLQDQFPGLDAVNSYPLAGFIALA